MPTAGVRVTLSVAVSLDGFIDDCGPERLRLSNTEDKAAVHELRAQSDAILVGAEAIRRDNPRLIIEDESIKAARASRGKTPELTKVSFTSSGNLPARAHFFALGSGQKIIYCPIEKQPGLQAHLGGGTVVVGLAGPHLSLSALLADLASRGVRELLVEGGARVLTQFLQQGIVDELRYAIAPFFVGNRQAPRFVHEAEFPFNKGNRLELASVSRLGDMAILTYRPAARP